MKYWVVGIFMILVLKTALTAEEEKKREKRNVALVKPVFDGLVLAGIGVGVGLGLSMSKKQPSLFQPSGYDDAPLPSMKVVPKPLTGIKTVTDVLQAKGKLGNLLSLLKQKFKKRLPGKLKRRVKKWEHNKKHTKKFKGTKKSKKKIFKDKSQKHKKRYYNDNPVQADDIEKPIAKKGKEKPTDKKDKKTDDGEEPEKLENELDEEE